MACIKHIFLTKYLQEQENASIYNDMAASLQSTKYKRK